MHDGKCDYLDFFGTRCGAEGDWDVYIYGGGYAVCCNEHQHHFATSFQERPKYTEQADGVS